MAWLVANADYKSQPLKNPHNDINLIRDSLQSIGFDVYSHYDLETVSDFQVAVREVMSVMLESSASEFLFYYSGHGIQVNGENYLMPTQADIQDEFEVPTRCYSVTSDLVQRTAALDSCASIIVLDACRVNPFEAGRYRSFASGKGLAKLDCPKGCLMAYSTEPGKVAEDGAGRNTSVYAEAFARNILVEGEEIQSILNRVQREVIIQTDERQFPVYESKLTVPVVFNPPGVLSLEEIENTVEMLETRMNEMVQSDILDNDFLSTLEAGANQLIQNVDQWAARPELAERVFGACWMVLMLRSEWLAWEAPSDWDIRKMDEQIDVLTNILERRLSDNNGDYGVLLDMLAMTRLECAGLSASMYASELELCLSSILASPSVPLSTRFRAIAAMTFFSSLDIDEMSICGEKGGQFQNSLGSLPDCSWDSILSQYQLLDGNRKHIRWLSQMGVIRSWKHYLHPESWCGFSDDWNTDMSELLWSSIYDSEALWQIRPEVYRGLGAAYLKLNAETEISKSTLKRITDYEIEVSQRSINHLIQIKEIDWEIWYQLLSDFSWQKQALNNIEEDVPAILEQLQTRGEEALEEHYRESMSASFKALIDWGIRLGEPIVLNHYRTFWKQDLEQDMKYEPDVFMSEVVDAWPKFLSGFLVDPDASILPAQIAVANVNLIVQDSVRQDLVNLEQMVLKTRPGGWLSFAYVLSVYNRADLLGDLGKVEEGFQEFTDLWAELKAVGPSELGQTVGFYQGFSSDIIFQFYLLALDAFLDEHNVGEEGALSLIEDIQDNWGVWDSELAENPTFFASLSISPFKKVVTSRDFLEHFIIGPRSFRGMRKDWLSKETYIRHTSELFSQSSLMDEVAQELGLFLALEISRGDKSREQMAQDLEELVWWLDSIQGNLGTLDPVYLGLANLCFYLEEFSEDEMLSFGLDELCIWQQVSVGLMDEWLERHPELSPIWQEWNSLDHEFRVWYKRFEDCEYDVDDLLGRFEFFEERWGLELSEVQSDFGLESTMYYHKAEMLKAQRRWGEAQQCFEGMLSVELDSVLACQWAQDVVSLGFHRNGFESMSSSDVFSGRVEFDSNAVSLEESGRRVLYADEGCWPVVGGIAKGDTVYAVRSSGHWSILSLEDMRTATRFSWMPNAEPTLGYDQGDLVDFLESNGDKVWTCASPVANKDDGYLLADEISQFPFDEVLSVGQFKEVENTGHTQALRYVYIN